MQFFNSLKKSKQLYISSLATLITRYRSTMSKPKVLVALKSVPQIAIDLLSER